MVRRSAWALSNRMSKAPYDALSAGISVLASQGPFTWRNRSSCGRTARSNDAGSSPDSGAFAGAAGSAGFMHATVPRHTAIKTARFITISSVTDHTLGPFEAGVECPTVQPHLHQWRDQ